MQALTQNARSYTINPALFSAVGLLMRASYPQGSCVFLPELQGHTFPTALLSQCQSLIIKTLQVSANRSNTLCGLYHVHLHILFIVSRNADVGREQIINPILQRRD